jgi:hypothetical protein
LKQILLSQGKIALVDDKDYKYLAQFKWSILEKKNTIYARRHLCSKIDSKRSTVLMHHEIIGKPLIGKMVDHKDGDGLNNQRQNLRFVTQRQNSQNTHKFSKTSKFPGVSWNKLANRWYSEIAIDGERKYLGTFKNEIDAFLIYKKTVEMNGEVLIDNFEKRNSRSELLISRDYKKEKKLCL